MISRSVSCSWCHRTNCLDNPGQVYCPQCFHRADVPRVECDCPRCTSTAEQRRELAQKDMADLLRKFDAAGGDLNKVLAGEVE